MTETQIKEYLNKYSLTTKEKLAEHIEQLKRNTNLNLELISELAFVLADEENLFFNVFGGQSPLMKCGEKWTPDYVTTLHADKIKRFGLLELEPKIVGDLEGINKPPQRTVSSHFLDEVLEQTNPMGKENTLSYQTYYQAVLTKPASNWNKLEITFSDSDINKLEETTISDIMHLFNNSSSAKEIKTEETKGHSTSLKANTPMKEDLVFTEDTELGKKTNKNKPQISLLFKQFPKALEAIAKCSEYGHEKYKETDFDYLNYTRVEGGSKTYADAGLRHRLEQGSDLESKLPHQYHIAWNALAELQLWIEENELKNNN